jgi:hypothetical protein
LEVALQVQKELENRFNEADKLRKQQVERAEYEANLARRRFMKVDPDNRLVADTLEAEWNEKLRNLQDASDFYEIHRRQEAEKLKKVQQKEVLKLAKDFPKLLRVTVATVRRWGKIGTIKTYPYNDRNGCLYEHPGVNSTLMKGSV